MELNKKRKGFLRTFIRQVDEENLTITHTINTKALDRYSTVVLPKGADVKHFLNNAVVLWSHNMDVATPKIPIAKCVSLDIREEEIEAVTEFNKKDPLAVKVFNAYRDGFLHAWSIGFMPMQYKQIDEENVEDINQKYGLKISKDDINDAGYWGVYLILKWELLEYSAVPVPGNPEALSADDESTFKRELVTRGLVDEKIANSMDIRASLKRDEEIPVEETPAEEAPVEETLAEEEEVPAEETPAGEVPAEETPAEEAPAEEMPAEEEAESTDSTEDNTESNDNVAEDTDTSEEEQDTNTERKALESKIDELNQKNQELSERLTNLETKLNELSNMNSVLAEIKQSLDVDNIEKVREAAQKRKAGQNPDTWFSNYIRSAK